jgi:hypothetical protein
MDHRVALLGHTLILAELLTAVFVAAGFIFQRLDLFFRAILPQMRLSESYRSTSTCRPQRCQGETVKVSDQEFGQVVAEH